MSSPDGLLLRILFLACAVPSALTTKLVQVCDDIALSRLMLGDCQKAPFKNSSTEAEPLAG